jgi:hypothetical protein
MGIDRTGAGPDDGADPVEQPPPVDRRPPPDVTGDEDYPSRADSRAGAAAATRPAPRPLESTVRTTSQEARAATKPAPARRVQRARRVQSSVPTTPFLNRPWISRHRAMSALTWLVHLISGRESGTYISGTTTLRTHRRSAPSESASAPSSSHRTGSAISTQDTVIRPERTETETARTARGR